MNDYGGLLLSFLEPEHRTQLLERIEQGSYFTYGISNRDLRPAEAEMCVLSFAHDLLNSICLAQRTKMVETGRMQLKFTRFVALEDLYTSELQPFGDMHSVLTELLTKQVARLSADQWKQLLAAIRLVRPSAATAIEELDAVRRSAAKKLGAAGFKTMAEEKDATRVALGIFGLDSETVKKTIQVKSANEPAPFLSAISHAKVLEDTMLAHDSAMFPDLDTVAHYVTGAIEFAGNDERITVLNVNRTPIEKVLGVDLIYYNHRYEAYVMVQYKRMAKIPGDWEFRLSNKQFSLDLERMNRFNTARPPTGSSGGPSSYRLAPERFFFKFCEEVTFRPLGTDLIEGMYLPLDYLQCLIASGALNGPAGGKTVCYSNAGRHLNNTQFIGLVRSGWVGSSGAATEALRVRRSWKAIQELAEQRRRLVSVVLDTLLAKIPTETPASAELLIEFHFEELQQAIDQNLFLRKQVKDTDASIERALMFLHDHRVIVLQHGLAIFRSAMTIRFHGESRGEKYKISDYQPLAHHYKERILQVHVMGEYARLGLDRIQAAFSLVLDYFRLPKEDFIRRYFRLKPDLLEYATTARSYQRIVTDLANSDQTNVVTAPATRNMLILAGPGSGKTRTVVHRCAYLLRVERVRPQSVLVCCFNRNAAIQIRRRLQDLVGDDARRVTVLTYHALAMRLLGFSYSHSGSYRLRMVLQDVP